MAAIWAWRLGLERMRKSWHQLMGHSSGGQGSWLQSFLEEEDFKVTTQRLRAQPLIRGDSPCGSCIMATLRPDNRSPRSQSRTGYRGSQAKTGRCLSSRARARAREHLGTYGQVSRTGPALSHPARVAPAPHPQPYWNWVRHWRVPGAGPQCPSSSSCSWFSSGRSMW